MIAVREYNTMSDNNFIPGKDASLDSSIQVMQAQLQQLGFHIEEHQWLNPIPNVWSVHIRDRDCPLFFTNGKGASKKAALASALGEFFERLSCNYFWADFYLGSELAEAVFVHYPEERWFEPEAEGNWPEELLTPELIEFYDPEATLDVFKLVDINSGNDARGICALPFTRQSDEEKVWFPVNIIGNLYVSNGMSAGNTKAEARTQALSEILERYVKNRIIAEGICLPDIPEAVLQRSPSIQQGIQALQDAGFSLLIKDASLGGKYPVINVTLINPEDQGCYASFGAHPQFDIALERALTELLQGRALDSLKGFAEPILDLEEVASSQNIETHFIDSSGTIHWNFLGQTPDYGFSDWNFEGSTEEEFQWLCDCIHDTKHDIYIMDYEHLGVYACRILVPGMSEIYPVEDLEWDNNNTGVELRETILNLADLADDECADLLDRIDEMGLDDQQPIAALIGLAPDAGSIWEDLRVAELKTLLALAISDDEAVIEGCNWIQHFQQINPQRRHVYHCIQTLLEMEDPSQYSKGILALYRRDAVQQAESLINGNTRFWNIGTPDLDLQNCELHQKLIQGYYKVHPELSA